MPASRLAAAWRSGRWKSVAHEKLALFAIVLLLICVALSLTVAALSIRNSSLAATSSRSRALENARRIDELTQALHDKNQVDADRQECTFRYNDQVDDSFRAYVSGIGDIVVALGARPPATPEAVAAAIKKLDQLNDAARMVAAERTKYFQDGRPLPCPLPA